MILLAPVLIGLAAGILSGLLGVGGGSILIPALVLGYHMPQHLAQGISLAVIIPTAITGLITFHRKGLIAYKMAGLLAAGSMIGILVSGNYVHLIPAPILKKFFGVFLAIMGFRTLTTADTGDCDNINTREIGDNDEKK